jgi:tRNA pseudouridine65 synthase
MTGPPRPSGTTFHPLAQCELPFPVSRYDSARFSLLACTPHTGRYHQIRLHMRHFRHTIIGDSQHGDKPQNRAFASQVGVSGLLLHAHRFHFNHPDGNRVELTAASPELWGNISEATGWNFGGFKQDKGSKKAAVTKRP